MIGLLFDLAVAGEYTSHAVYSSDSKLTACEQALTLAQHDALKQAGTLVIGSFSNYATLDQKEAYSIKSDYLQTLSVGIAKMRLKHESVQVTDDYCFICTVDATFEIDENDVKHSAENYLENNSHKFQEKIVITAKGYSAEGQSKYEALKAAELDAKRNLLNEIKRSTIHAKTESHQGKIESDIVISELQSSIQNVKILSQQYDQKTGSAEVVVGLSEKGLENYRIK